MQTFTLGKKCSMRTCCCLRHFQYLSHIDPSCINLWHWYNYKQEWLGYVAQSKIYKFIRLYLKNSNGLFWGHCLCPSISGKQAPLTSVCREPLPLTPLTGPILHQASWFFSVNYLGLWDNTILFSLLFDYKSKLLCVKLPELQCQRHPEIVPRENP